MMPRLMLAGTGGDSGKTLVTVGLAAAWRCEGLCVVPFKKGPDYIDSAWLALAAGKTARNLDTWMMGTQAVLHSFVKNATPNGINLIEGNRGLYDGEDVRGTHSSAELAKLLKAPVVLVVPAIKVTRTVAALVLGLKLLDPEVKIAGVILNRIATARQEAMVQTAVEESTGLPVLGAIPRIKEELLPSRHLGLVTPEEHARGRKVVDSAADILARSVDLSRIRTIAEDTVSLEIQDSNSAPGFRPATSLRIGYFQSSAFTFYYPENLEAIDYCGAQRIPIDPLKDQALPVLDALYIGGGFPETHAPSLADNVAFRKSVADGAQRGLPIWAECGGLMFLCRSLHWKGQRYPMAGFFPADIVLGDSPAGHGYQEVVVDRPNPFIKVGTTLRGHEFHYSRIEGGGPLDTIFQVKRGTGLGNGRDGLIANNVVASYLHLHALGTEEWIIWLLKAAADFARSRR